MYVINQLNAAEKVKFLKLTRELEFHKGDTSGDLSAS
jgi:hypothetical protein